MAIKYEPNNFLTLSLTRVNPEAAARDLLRCRHA